MDRDNRKQGEQFWGNWKGKIKIELWYNRPTDSWWQISIP